MTTKELLDQLRAESEETYERELKQEGTPGHGTATRPNRAASSVFTVRLSDDTLSALNALAESLDVPVSVVARGFILDGLAASEGDDLRTALERLERDLQTVKARALSA